MGTIDITMSLPTESMERGNIHLIADHPASMQCLVASLRPNLTIDTGDTAIIARGQIAGEMYYLPRGSNDPESLPVIIEVRVLVRDAWEI